MYTLYLLALAANGGAHSALMTDSLAYCASVGTISRPGAPYRGPAHPAWIRRAVKAGSDFTWRREGGRVLACVPGNSGLNAYTCDRWKLDLSAPCASRERNCRWFPAAWSTVVPERRGR
jgi:hypothetical protein